MPKRLYRSGQGNTVVPRGAVLIDPRIINIKAVKGKQSNWPGEWFIHKFKKGGRIYHVPNYKLPSGAELIYSRLQSIKGSRGNYKFENPASGKVYGLSNGNIVITNRGQKLLVVANHPLWDTFDYSDE